MRDRYPSLTSGFRLDEPDSVAAAGPCIDGSAGLGDNGLDLYVCEAHTNRSVRLALNASEVTALRDGLNRILLHLGVDKQVTINTRRVL